jgi:hypothetical protein
VDREPAVRATDTWNGREAVRLTNGRVELIALVGGGHIAAFRFLDITGLPSQNVLWESPWKTYEPNDPWSDEMSSRYGPRVEGKFLASFTGHALCLDLFGDPTPQEAEAGRSLHGEAAVRRWTIVPDREAIETQCSFSVDLPTSGLNFGRTIRLDATESLVYFEETVHNEQPLDHDCDWIQHVTLGPPFLNKNESFVETSGTRGVTWPFVADEGSLLANDREFHWPYAMDAFGTTAKVDLRAPFSAAGRGFLAGVQLDSHREIEFLLAFNARLRLGLVYCFRRKDFPFLTIWEENCGRRSAPWNGKAQARGMEFGTSPLPIGRQSAIVMGTAFRTSKKCVIPADGSRTARYLMFLFFIPQTITSLTDVRIVDDMITIYDSDGVAATCIPASGCAQFLDG